MARIVASILIIWSANTISIAAESARDTKSPTFLAPANVPPERTILQGGDDFSDAYVIESIPFHDNGTTAGYTNNYDAICPYDSSTAPDVVYSYTSVADVTVDIDLCRGSNYDTKLYVFAASDTLNFIDCNDDYCSSPNFPYGWISHINSLYMINGMTYYIVVDGYRQSYGNYTIDIIYSGPCGQENEPFFNGFPDDVNCLPACRNYMDTNSTWVIDDMTFDRSVSIQSLHWYAVNENQYSWTQGADFIIVADSQGVPGQALCMIPDVPSERQPTGRQPFGRLEFIYSIDNLHITLLPGTYWLGVRPLGYQDFQSFWMTSPGQGNRVYVDYPPDNPAWTPGSQVFGADYDVSFCASGAYACDYVIGDINDNGLADGMDVTYGVTFFKGGPAPHDSCNCPPQPYPFYAAGDVNGNCAFNGIDLTYFIAYLKGLQEILQGCADCPAVLGGATRVDKGAK